MAILLTSLAGCQLPMRDMLNNNFVAIIPSETPSELVGVWTGSMGPYLSSLQLQQDGYGYFCYSYGTADVLQKIKFSEGSLLIQDGTRLIVREFSSKSLTLHAPYFAGKDTVFYSDAGFKNTSMYCASEFQKAVQK